MGDNVLKQQLRNFKRRKDQAKCDASIPRFFQRPEIIETLYEATPTNGKVFQAGEVLVALAISDHDVALFEGNKKVATLTGDSGAVLHTALTEPDAGGAIHMLIESIEPLSGSLKVKATRVQQ